MIIRSRFGENHTPSPEFIKIYNEIDDSIYHESEIKKILNGYKAK